MNMGEVDNNSKAIDVDGNHSGSDASEPDKLSQERQNIVNKYTKGIGRDDESDRLGEAEFTDQYGFVLKAEPLPLSKPEDDRRKQNEVKRRTKWLKMVRHWDKYSGTEKLFKRVYKGIPQSMRGDVWKLLLQVNQYMDNMPAVYKEMKTRAHSHSNDIRQIDLDVNRTYRDHEMFRKRYSIKQQELFHVLAAYSMYNTEVGYCQGMSQIAALLLMYMSEEEAFWALHSLLYGERHKMHGFFIPGFPKLIRFQEHHDRVLKKLMPKLKKHLDENEVFASLYTMKWFFQCFLDRSPFSLTLRLWDIYVLEGEKLLVAMSYATLKLHKAYLKSQDMDGIVSFLQEQLGKDFGAPDDSIVEHLKDCMSELRKFHMDLPPRAHDMENPKLPFGTFIPTNDMAQAKVPEFTKHAVDITTLLPNFNEGGSGRKKPVKVKRGKSAAGKSSTSNGINHASKLSPIKEGEATTKEPEVFSRSPASRGSRKVAKRNKPGDPAQLGKNTPKTSPKQKTGSKDTRANDKTSNGPSKSASSERKKEPTVMTKKDSGGRKSNGKTVYKKHEKRPGAVETPPANSGPDSDSTTATSYHSNNSNNSQITNEPKKTHNHRPEPFIPPILGHISSSSYDTHSTDSNSSPTRKVVPTWNVPSGGKRGIKTSNTLRPTKGVMDHSNPPVIYNSLAPYSQTMSRKKSQSSDHLKDSVGSTLKSKTISFSELSAALDTIDSASQVSSPTFSATSDSGSHKTRSSRKKSPSARPISYYDNVPVGSYGHEDFHAPVSDKIVKGVEASSHLMPETSGSKKKSGRNGTGRRNTKSMGDLQSSLDINHKRKDVSQNKDVLRVASHKTHERRIMGSKSVAEDSLLRNSPFQKAILANGILDPPVSRTRGRRMSREEVVTAAVLSQMESKSRRGYPNRKHHRKSAKMEDDSNFKKSKSAASLAQDSRYIDWQGTRNESIGTEQVILPQIMPNYAISPREGHAKGISMRKNLSMDALNGNSEKSWGTTELDASYPTFSIASTDSRPVHPLQMFPSTGSCDTFHQSVPSHSPSHYFKRQSQDISSLYHLRSTGGISLMHVPQTSQTRDIVTLRAIPPNSEINQLLSAGINADSTSLRKYDLLHPRVEQQVLAAPYGSNRRHSVNMAVQTEESRVS